MLHCKYLSCHVLTCCFCPSSLSLIFLLPYISLFFVIAVPSWPSPAASTALFEGCEYSKQISWRAYLAIVGLFSFPTSIVLSLKVICSLIALVPTIFVPSIVERFESLNFFFFFPNSSGFRQQTFIVRDEELILGLTTCTKSWYLTAVCCCIDPAVFKLFPVWINLVQFFSFFFWCSLNPNLNSW